MITAPSGTDLAPEYAGVPISKKRVKTTLPPPPESAPLATFLGVFSLGLGLWEVLSPHGVSRRTGVRSSTLIRGYGVREIAAGVGILTSERPAFWLWNRVAGDVLDLATLAAAYHRSLPADRTRALEAAAAVLGVTVLDILCACEHSTDSD